MSGSSPNELMVRALERDGYIRSREVREAFLSVDRRLFVWPGTEGFAYMDEPLPLGDTGQTISAPSMIAMMLEALELKPYQSVLEVGMGSGYSAALISRIIRPGHVVSVEINYRLYLFGRRNLAGYTNVIPAFGDGTVGFPPYSREEMYDRVVLMAAARRVPEPLLQQLRPGGFALAPLGEGDYQVLTKVYKDGGRESLGGCIFVKLRGINA